jgi:regulator of protease activity HflC (stomatin/prohibitin superfamily)
MERRAFRIPGFVMLLLLLAAEVALVVVLSGQADQADQNTTAGVIVAGCVLGMVLAFLLAVSGFTVLSPNEARVVQFFGRYVGAISRAGFHWTVPFSTKRKVSLRVRNFESNRLKVSDADGNPVEVAAVVVYKVVDPAKAVFAVDNYVQYVSIQAEAAVRHLATSHPYESHDDERVSLREGPTISAELTAELRERVVLAGVEVVESRITHLAYAPEIAQVMLQRQQANAVVAARSRIVEGAVGMVHMALDRLREEGVVELDEERKAQMVSNLLVVLCGDRATQPVVNAGSLYA